MIKALHKLHANKIVHRDIRHHNIFYSNNKNVFILGGFKYSKVLNGKPN
jgi:serine/threonine protein kinase